MASNQQHSLLTALQFAPAAAAGRCLLCQCRVPCPRRRPCPLAAGRSRTACGRPGGNQAGRRVRQRDFFIVTEGAAPTKCSPLSFQVSPSGPCHISNHARPAPTCVLPQRYSPYSSVMEPVSRPPPRISLSAVQPVLIMSNSERCSKICCAVVKPHGTIFWAAKRQDSQGQPRFSCYASGWQLKGSEPGSSTG